MKKLLVVLFLVSLFQLLASKVAAQYGQYQAPSPSISILINKMVSRPDATTADPTTSQYVDNLSPSDPRFQPGQTVFFKLEVKNTSNITLTNVTVQDFVPAYLTPISGPGTFDSSSRTITFSAGDFNPGDDKVYYFNMQVLPQGQLPSDKGLFCVINQATASNSQASDSATSQLCIEKQVMGVTTVPSAGPELGAALLAFNLLSLGTGLWLKKKI